MNRIEILDKAKEIITKERRDCYGNIEDNFNKIASYWSLYLDIDITGQDVANMMIFLKIARIQTGGYHADNYIDIAGYTACAGELESK